MQKNYWLTISKNFWNVNKYCKINSLYNKLPISIWTCDKRIRNFIQESYDILIKPDNVLNMNWELRPVYMTLNSYLTNNTLSIQSNEWQIKNIRNSITSIIKNQPNLLISIDWDIAIQIASLNIILNDYIINSTDKTSSITTTNTPKQNSNDIKDCKNDYDCFIEQSKTCTPSKVIRDTTIDMFWITTTTKSSYEIKWLKNNKCDFYLKTMEQKVLYSSWYIQMGLDSWLTMDEINEELEAANQQTQAIKGLDWTCNLSTTYLTQILNEWKKWTLNTKQLTSKDCSWKLFPNNSMIINL